MVFTGHVPTTGSGQPTLDGNGRHSGTAVSGSLAVTGGSTASGGSTRRRVLGTATVGLVGMAVPAGCGLFDDAPRPVAPPDPLLTVLAEALALAAAHDRAALTRPELRGRLAPLAEAHRAHAAELARTIGAGANASASSAPPGPPGGDAEGVLQTLRRAEQTAQRTAVAQCLRAPAERVGLLGSIAAARATHAEALR